MASMMPSFLTTTSHFAT